LSLAASLRVQLLPAIALTGLWQMFTTFRDQRRAFLGSGLLIGLLYGAVDGFIWSYPFEALWRNVAANLYYGIQTEYGVSPWYWYLTAVLEYWTGLGAAMLALCLIGALRLPQPFVAGRADRADLFALRTQGAALHLSGDMAGDHRQRHRSCAARRVDRRGPAQARLEPPP
jgi:Alg9-like mannosyltransferase family